jgi:hypothetical protein
VALRGGAVGLAFISDISVFSQGHGCRQCALLAFPPSVSLASRLTSTDVAPTSPIGAATSARGRDVVTLLPVDLAGPVLSCSTGNAASTPTCGSSTTPFSGDALQLSPSVATIRPTTSFLPCLLSR